MCIFKTPNRFSKFEPLSFLSLKRIQLVKMPVDVAMRILKYEQELAMNWCFIEINELTLTESHISW